MQLGLTETLKNIWSLISSFTFFDFLDICLVTFIIYNVIKLIRQTKAIQLVKGIVALGALFVVVKALNMQVTSYILSRVFADVVLVMLLLFQPEIRRVLESMGKRRIGSRGKVLAEADETITAVCKACSNMSDEKVGALIVFEKDTLLGEIADSGNKIDALATSEMIGNIFYPKAPLHDGAAIIRDNRVVSAGCILPLTNDALTSDLGTRHRAAVGLSEQSDAVIVVVSEETGAISVAHQGLLRRGISPGELREILLKHFAVEDKGDQSFFGRLFGGKKNG